MRGGGLVEPDRWRCRGLEPAGGVREVPEDGSGWAAQAESIPLPRTMNRVVPFASDDGWVSACACIQVGGRRGKGGLPFGAEGGGESFLWVG